MRFLFFKALLLLSSYAYASDPHVINGTGVVHAWSCASYGCYAVFNNDVNVNTSGSYNPSDADAGNIEAFYSAPNCHFNPDSGAEISLSTNGVISTLPYLTTLQSGTCLNSEDRYFAIVDASGRYWAIPTTNNGYRFDQIDGLRPWMACSNSDTFSSETGCASPTSPQPVPTISVWGLGILAGLLGLIGFVRRRKV